MTSPNHVIENPLSGEWITILERPRITGDPLVWDLVLAPGGRVPNSHSHPEQEERQPALDANLTAEENIRLHAVLYGLYPWRPWYRLMPTAYRQQVRDLSDILGIAASLGRPVRSLSGGTRRKLEIVRALLHRPRVLFLDEPSTGLDPQSRRSLWSHLRETRAQNGTTIVLTTHYLEEAESADAVCVLTHGRIAERGTPAEIKTRHASPTLEEAYLTMLGNQS
jgi:ABC-2 type transport system ATP-binding protein